MALQQLGAARRSEPQPVSCVLHGNGLRTYVTKGLECENETIQVLVKNIEKQRAQQKNLRQHQRHDPYRETLINTISYF